MKLVLKLSIILVVAAFTAHPSLAASKLLSQGQWINFHFTKGPLKNG